MVKFDAAFRSEFGDNRIALALAIVCMTFTFSAPTFSLPFLFPEVIREFGWTREQATLLASAKYATGAVAALLVGRFIDSIGAMAALAVAAAIGGAGMIGFLWVGSLTSYYAMGMLLGFAGPGTITAVKVLISQRFHRSQGTAMGIALLGASVGSMIVPIAIATLISAFGWRMGIALMSLGVWLITLPVLLVAALSARKQAARAPEVGKGTPIDFKSLAHFMKRPVFWLLAGSVFLGGMVDQAFIQHQVLIFSDLSLSQETIAIGISAMGIIGFFGRVIAGNIFDRTSTRGAAAFYVVLGFASLLAMILGNPLIFAAFIVMRAVAHSGVLLDTTVITKHVFGTERLGTLLGVYTAFITAGFAVGPWLMGLLFNLSDSYALAFPVFFGIALAAAALMILVEPIYWKALKAAHGPAATA